MSVETRICRHCERDIRTYSRGWYHVDTSDRYCHRNMYDFNSAEPRERS